MKRKILSTSSIIQFDHVSKQSNAMIQGLRASLLGDVLTFQDVGRGLRPWKLHNLRLPVVRSSPYVSMKECVLFKKKYCSVAYMDNFEKSIIPCYQKISYWRYSSNLFCFQLTRKSQCFRGQVQGTVSFIIYILSLTNPSFN